MRVILVLVLFSANFLVGNSSNFFAGSYRMFPPREPPTVERQQDINHLFNVIYVSKEQEKDIYGDEDFKYKSKVHENFQNFSAANTYLGLLEQNKTLPRGEIFKPFKVEHLEESILLYDFLISSRNFEILIETSSWLKRSINEGLYLFTISQVLAHSEQTNQYILPPIYELYPWYFFPSKVINEAQKYHQTFPGEHLNDSDYLHIKAEYTTEPMSYFTEDVGINAYYYYFNLYYPPTRINEPEPYDYPPRGSSGQKDEAYYFFYQQFLARYYLERLSNNLGRIPNLNWHQAFKAAFNPQLSYHNGKKYPIRDDVLVFNKEILEELLTTSSAIDDAVDLKYIELENGNRTRLYDTKGIKLIQNLIHGNPRKSIDITGRQLLGSAMENIETSIRDPAFYMFYKYILRFYHKYTSSERVYLNPEDFKVTGINVDKLETYFEDFNSEISHSCILSNGEYVSNSFKVFAKQQRLNHYPFNYSITVDSNVQGTVLVKVFMGPKYDEFGKEINLQENRLNFVLFDMFYADLNPGDQVLHRNSEDNILYAPDQQSYFSFDQLIGHLYRNDLKYDFEQHGSRRFLKWPKRFLLPKGSPEGVPYQLFVYTSRVYAYGKQSFDKNLDLFHREFETGNTLGYPFDKRLNLEEFDKLPNKLFKEVKIYHKRM